MLELALVLACVVVLAGLGLIGALVPPMTLLWIALGLVGAGALLGLPGGLLYHVVLRRELLALGELPPLWYLQPTRWHGLLDDSAYARVRVPFLCGAFGFLLMMSGSGLAALTLFRFGSG